MIDKNLVQQLCCLNGTSGDEGAVAEFVQQTLTRQCIPFCKDVLGNIIATVGQPKPGQPVVMVSAHMDEVALIVTDIDKDGSLLFDCVGGISPKVLPGKGVWVNGHFGTVGIPPVHLCGKEERSKALAVQDMRIDIGAADKQAASALVQVGDIAYFDAPFEQLGDKRALCKAADDRLGCAILLQLCSQPLPLQLHLAFCTQEEVGCRGAAVAANTIAPQVALVLECTTAADNVQLEESKQVCNLGQGAVIGFMDRGNVYSRDLVKLAANVATWQKIPFQYKRGIFGGNDSQAIAVAGAGCKTLAISVPARNLHTPSLVFDWGDADATYRLLVAVLNKLC